MSENGLNKSDVELLSTAIQSIVSSEVLENTIVNELPLISDLQDSNKIYQCKASMLFVDMRDSTKLPQKFSTEQLVKIYRSYIRTVVQAIRYSGGIVRDFMGDGVLAVFIDGEDGTSEDKAVHAARYIVTAIDKILNPVLDQSIHHRISYGIGIHTGDISVSKVGMRGKGNDSNSEDEFGIAWIGNSTNLSCKFSSSVECGTIFICSSTYVALSDSSKSAIWEEYETSKGNSILSGYIAKHHYLQLDPELEPYPANRCSSISLIETIRNECQIHLSTIEQKAKELGEKERDIEAIERQLRQQTEKLTTEKQRMDRERYRFYCNVIRSAHCKKAYAVAMGRTFWEDNLSEAIKAGKTLGIDADTVREDLSFAMVSIYESLEMYEEAYDSLVDQATGNSWIHFHTVQRIVDKVGYCSRLKSAIDRRIESGDLDSSDWDDFMEAKMWLESKFS